MDTEDSELRLSQSSNVVMRQVAGETLLIPINQTGADLQKIYVLNDTAAAVWKALKRPIRLLEIISALAKDYDAPKDIISKEVGQLIQEFLSRGFVTLHDD